MYSYVVRIIFFSFKRVVYVRLFVFHIKPHVPLAHGNNKFDQNKNWNKKQFHLFAECSTPEREITRLQARTDAKDYELCFNQFLRMIRNKFRRAIKFMTLAHRRAIFFASIRKWWKEFNFSSCLATKFSTKLLHFSIYGFQLSALSS